MPHDDLSAAAPAAIADTTPGSGPVQGPPTTPPTTPPATADDAPATPDDAPVADPRALALLREDLTGWTVDAVHAVLGEVAHAALAREMPEPARRACARSDAPEARLLELFVLGEAVAVADVDAALPRVGAAGAAACSLVRVDGGAVRALVDLRPFAVAAADATDDDPAPDSTLGSTVDALHETRMTSWWVASDLGETATSAPLRPDHVLGVGGASVTLAQATVRRRVGRVLDLGTGCGVQALQAATHAREVVATDVSQRALAFTRFAAELNAPALAGVTIETRLGDLLEPVAGETFDLIVSNPPFVITPRAEGVPAYEYRDAGREGDAVVRDLVRALPGHLAPGGVAQMLGNWEHHEGRDWRERWQEWLDGSPLRGEVDVWVVQREVQDPAEYAQMWIRDAGAPDDAAQRRLVDAWLDDFERRGVEAVGFGLITLRRPDAPRAGVVRIEECRGSREDGLGAHIGDVLDAVEWSATHDDAALLQARLRVAPDVTEERHHLPGTDDPQVILLRQGGGFGRAVRAGTALAAVVGACDGELPLGVIVGAVAHLLDVPADAVAAEVLPDVRELLVTAMLRPAS